MDAQKSLAKAEIKGVLKAKNPSIGQRIDRDEIEKPLLQKGIPASDIQDAVYILMSEGFLERYTEHSDKNWFSDLKVTVSGSTDWLNKKVDFKQFRAEVLSAHYNLAEGGTMHPVIRTEIATLVGIDNYNDKTLLDAIFFLEGKGFLKSVDNMDDCITTSGVEEVENDFPVLKSVVRMKTVSNLSNNHKQEFVHSTRIQELKTLTNKDFDLTKLVRLCEELNTVFQNDCYLATALLTRSIIDHVPPIFSKESFKQVASNYGNQSFKESMSHLDVSSRKIADAHLHTHIRSKENLPNETQVNFSNDLDVLLAEICRLLK